MQHVLILALLVVFIVIATSRFKLHPFITLLASAFIAAFSFGLPVDTIAKTITSGFGGILGYIGLVIVLGTIIGGILERSGAAITMANTVIKLLGKRFPNLTMAIIGYLVSIPVFCDSGFVILNSLKESMAKAMKVSPIGMSVALAGGLYATHTFVPPTPGPIAAAGNLGLESNLGLVIVVGLGIAFISAVVASLWGNRFIDQAVCEQSIETTAQAIETPNKLPTTFNAFAPIFIPILLICLGSIANFPSAPFGDAEVATLFKFMGQPVVALLMGLAFALRLLEKDNRAQTFAERVSEGLTAAAPILLITGAGGAFGAVLKASGLGAYLGEMLSALGVGIFMPFIVAAALKSAQGSSTVALVTTSAMVAPMLAQFGLDSEMGRVLVVMAIGAGAMTVSHANDSFFWVVSQFSKMSPSLAYRAHTVSTLLQGVTAMAVIYLISLVAL